MLAGDRRLAIWMIVVSALLFSLNGPILRLMTEANALQATFYRSAAMSVALLLTLFFVYGGSAVSRICAIGWHGVAAGTLLGLASITIFVAMDHTTVANTSFINSAIPFFSAALAWLVLREQVTGLMLACMITAFCGVGIMLAGSVALNQTFGCLIAVLSALVFSVFVVILRIRRQTNMTPVVAVSGVIACGLITFLTGGDLTVPLRDLLLALAWGALIAACGHSLFVLAAARLLAGEVTFLMLLEYVLGPVWVWLIVNEVPASTSLIGGTVVLGALMVWATRQSDQK